jgi:hypothetical protein
MIFKIIVKGSNPFFVVYLNMFFKKLKEEFYIILIKNYNGLLFFFFMNLTLLLLNIFDYTLLNNVFQFGFFLFFYIHVVSIIFFNISIIFIFLLIYFYYFNKKYFEISDYSIVFLFFYYHGTNIIISGSFWGICVWGFNWFEDDRILSLFIILFVVFFFNKLILYLYNNLIHKKKLIYLFTIMLFVFIFFIIILKFSVDWWYSIHQGASFDFFDYLISYKIYLNFIDIIIVGLFLNLIFLKYTLKISNLKRIYENNKK